MAVLAIPRLQRLAPIVESMGNPSNEFHIWWDRVAAGIESQFNDITGALADIAALQADMADRITEITQLQSDMQDRIDEITQLQTDMADTIADLAAAVADIAAAQAAADAAQADADTAQTTADDAAADAIEAAREAARLVSYPNPGAGILSATDAGATASITISNHTRVYPVQGSIDVPDVSITGTTLTGLSFSTKYFIYYDDTTLADTTPTFVATTSAATAQVGAAAGRHIVGYITTPADGGGNTSGDGGGTPGGLGGSGAGGACLP